MSEIQKLFIQHPTLYFLHFAFWAACAFYFCRFALQTLKELNRLPYCFYITDMWTAILCLLPFYMLIRHMVEERITFSTENVYPLAVTLASECLGMCMGVAYSWPEEGRKMPRRLHQSAWIVGGALIGLVGMVITTASLLFLIFFFFVVSTCSPVWLVLLGLFAFCRSKRPKNLK